MVYCHIADNNHTYEYMILTYETEQISNGNLPLLHFRRSKTLYVMVSPKSLLCSYFYSREHLFILESLLNWYWQIVVIPIGSNCAPLVAELVLFCYEILSLSY